MSAKTRDAGTKPSTHSCKSDARRLRKSKKTSGDVAISGGSKIKDLPVYALEKIFQGYRSFKNLEQVGEFDENFGKAAGKLLHAAYLKLENDLLQDITESRKKFAATLLADETDKDQSVIKRKMLCKSIHQLETLSSTFAHVKATIWSYTSAGICSHYDGELLDYFERARTSIISAINREPVTKPAPDRLIGRCRELAATFIWNFLLEVEEKTLSEEERRSVDILGAITLLNTLICAKDSSISPILLIRYKDSQLVSMTVDFSLPYCWMGYFASKDYDKQPLAERAVDTMHIIRQLVWVSNSEYHLHEWQETTKLIDMPQPKIPKSTSLLLGEGAYVNDGKKGRCFASIEADDERVFYFGFRSRAKYRTCTRSSNQNFEERIRLVDRVVTIPKEYKEAVLDVQLSITCDEKLLPESLCSRAVSEERGLPVGLTPGFALKIVSYENGARSKRVCEFPCYETERRHHDKRLLIGDHGWRMMQVGDSVDKHKIYEAEGKIKLEASPNLYIL